MRGLVLLIFAVLAVGCVVGLFFAYKAVRLKAEVSMWKGYHDSAVLKLSDYQRDYAGISVYAAENKKLLAETTLEERKKMTVLLGASITKRWDTDAAFPGKGVINRGVGSQSDTQLLDRFSSDVLQLEPGRVVIKFCSGNFNPQADFEMIWDEYEMMAMTAKRRGIKPMLATIIPVTRGAEEFQGYSITSEIKRFNERLMKFASENHFTVVDYFKAMADSDGYLPDDMAVDTIHANVKGYAKMAAVLGPLL